MGVTLCECDFESHKFAYMCGVREPMKVCEHASLCVAIMTAHMECEPRGSTCVT